MQTFIAVPSNIFFFPKHIFTGKTISPNIICDLGMHPQTGW